jgi:hypothetical protein
MATLSVPVPRGEWTLISQNSISYQITEQASAYIAESETKPTDLINRRKINPGQIYSFSARLSEKLYVYCESSNINISVAPPRKVEVIHQDVGNPLVVANFNKTTNITTLTAEATQDDDVINVASVVGVLVGSYIIIFSSVTNRFFIAKAISTVDLTITLDTQLSSTFPIGSNVNIGIINMNVDGSTTRQVFGIRGIATPFDIAKTVHITRIIMICFTETVSAFNQFGDLDRLTRGLVLRKRNGITNVIFNVKDNAEIEGITLDWRPYDALNLQQGQYGFSARLTFSGAEKMGAVAELNPGEDLELVIQDDLEGLLSLYCVAEGHVAID